MKNIINNIKTEFIKRIGAKNSWGKNEIEKVYIETINDILVEYIDKPIVIGHFDNIVVDPATETFELLEYGE